MAQSATEWPTPRVLDLDGPGPYELPLCGHASVLGQGSDPNIVLMLETVGRLQTVHVPIESGQLPALKMLIDHLTNQYRASTKASN
jgi:hypothetical protein